MCVCEHTRMLSKHQGWLSFTLTSPHYFLAQDLSQNLELTISAGLTGQKPVGSFCHYP